MMEIRYFRWRSAIKRSIWAIDQYWYMMLGMFYVHEHPKLRKPPVEAASMGALVPLEACAACPEEHTHHDHCSHA